MVVFREDEVRERGEGVDEQEDENGEGEEDVVGAWW